MNEELKTLYAQWIFEECTDPISEIEWLVNCIIHNKGKKKYPKYRKSKHYQKAIDLSLAFLFSQLIATTFLLYLSSYFIYYSIL